MLANEHDRRTITTPGILRPFRQDCHWEPPGDLPPASPPPELPPDSPEEAPFEPPREIPPAPGPPELPPEPEH